ncbi:MAG: MFS transporter [Gammaproteobacteria bacterium]|nr:MFS transporter [Gammaproteobacteria bacterium]MDX5375818.1 MFS transporter [Gammaproteobacteria bacterium]
MALRGTTLVAYGLPGLPLALLGLPLYVYLPTFYAEDLGLPLALVGAVLLLARGLDVLTDPLIGLLSDRGHAALGRKAFIALGVPLLLLGIESLFRPDGSPGGLYLLGWTLAAYLGWTLISVPYGAWGAELPRGPDSYHQRSRLAAWREGFMILGTLAAVALPAALGIAGDAGATLARFANLLWWLLPLAVAIALWRVPPAPRQPATATRGWRALSGALRQDAHGRRLLLAYLLNGIANGLPATLFLLFVTHNLQAPGWTGGLLAAYFVSGVLALPAWLWLARRIDKARAWAASMLVASLAFLAVPWLGPGDAGLFLVICLVSGLGLGADLALPASIQADLAMRRQARDGAPRAGAWFGLWGMVTKLALALAVGIAFPLLALAGLDPEAGPTPSLALGLLYGGLPILFKLAACALAWHLPRLDTDTPTQEDTHAPPTHPGRARRPAVAPDGL